MKSDYQKALEKAKIKYRDAVRGFEYQEYLINKEYSNVYDYEYISRRRDIFKAEFTVLEDVFGVAALTTDTPQRLVRSDYLQTLSNEIDVKMNELQELEDKIARRIANEKNN